MASFVCGAPARKPQVLVLVVIDNPRSGGSHQGGRVAAPAASKILKRALLHLRIPPESHPQPKRTAQHPTGIGGAG